MSSITNINGTDLITDSRADINQNFTNLNNDKMETSVLDTDTTLAANSDAKVPTQKAVKAYVDAGGNVNATETTRGIVEIATAAEAKAETATGSTGASVVLTPASLSGIKAERIVIAVADSPATWTKDTGLKRIHVQAWGGGGGGSNNATDGGGGGGGFSEKWFEASELGATETVTIGAGGATGGGDGGNTTFGSLLTAYGGEGGSVSAGGNAGGPLQAGATGSGVMNAAGGAGAGEDGIFGGAGGFNGTNAGRSYWGGGGGAEGAGTAGVSIHGGAGGADGIAGSVPGGGGGRAAVGGAGQVIVTEYYV